MQLQYITFYLKHPSKTLIPTSFSFKYTKLSISVNIKRFTITQYVLIFLPKTRYSSYRWMPTTIPTMVLLKPSFSNNEKIVVPRYFPPSAPRSWELIFNIIIEKNRKIYFIFYQSILLHYTFRTSLNNQQNNSYLKPKLF